MQQLFDIIRDPPRLALHTLDRDPIEFDFKNLVSHARQHIPTSEETRLGRELRFLGKRPRFHNFASADIDSLIAWPDERLGSAGLVQSPKPDWFQKAYVNSSRASALAWFKDLTFATSRNEHPPSVIVFGDPGTGKSTLLKYLIQRTRDHSQQHGVIYSRFETRKFLATLDEAGIKDQDEMIAWFSHYIYALALRDVMYTDAARETGASNLCVRAGAHHFGSPRAIDDLLHVALGSHRLVREEEIAAAGDVLRSFLQPHGQKSRELLNIPRKALALIVRHVLDGRRVNFVIDGLDYLSPNDRKIETTKYQLFQMLMSQFRVGGPGDVKIIRLKAIFPQVGAQIIALRQRTYQTWLRQVDSETGGTDVAPPRVQRVYVAPPNAKVVLWKNVHHTAAGANLVPLQAELFDVILKAVNASVKAVATNSSLARRRSGLTCMFDGNLRDEFTFVRRLMLWVARDLMGLEIDDGLDVFFSKLAHLNFEKAIERKSYRIVELLLKFDSAVFENLATVSSKGYVTSGGLRIPPILRRNHYFSGLIDNVFNYSIPDSHSGFIAHHCLLFKIRILQCLISRAVSARQNDDIFAPHHDPSVTGHEIVEYLRRLGYSSQALTHLDEVLMVLHYGGYVREQLHDDDAGVAKPVLQRDYSVTERGHFVVADMLQNTGYLEHVFHKTLFPKIILPPFATTPREENVTVWSVNSIVNYFVLLSYVRYLESNIDGAVAADVRLFPRMLAAISKSVENIVRDEERSSFGGESRIGKEAYSRISALIEIWRERGVLEPEPQGQ